MTEIILSNPFAGAFEQYIVYNAMMWQARAVVEIEPTLKPGAHKALKADLLAHRPGMAYTGKKFHDAIDDFARANYVVEQGSGKGLSVVICGAGPSLTEHAKDYCNDADQVWGCNSALTYLANNGHRVTHGITVDQTAAMYTEWKDASDDVEYLVATTIHPHLTDLLVSRGRKARYFNNFVGLKKPPVKWPDVNGVERVLDYEAWIYAVCFPGTLQAGSGLNTLTRALDVATYMDFDHITVLGADCSLKVKGRFRSDLKIGSPKHLKWLREKTTMHADGGSALASEATPLVLNATIDGRPWATKIDFAISAQWIHKMRLASKGKIEVIGDVLPNALVGKDEAWLRRLPQLVRSDGQVIEIPF
jgi:hypothetical protein